MPIQTLAKPCVLQSEAVVQADHQAVEPLVVGTERASQDIQEDAAVTQVQHPTQVQVVEVEVPQWYLWTIKR